METKEMIIKGHKVEKCIGEGQCSCVDCSKEKGFNLIWTCFCYKYNNDILCYEHLIKRLER